MSMVFFPGYAAALSRLRILSIFKPSKALTNLACAMYSTHLTTFEFPSNPRRPLPDPTGLTDPLSTRPAWTPPPAPATTHGQRCPCHGKGATVVIAVAVRATDTPLIARQSQ